MINFTRKPTRITLVVDRTSGSEALYKNDLLQVIAKKIGVAEIKWHLTKGPCKLEFKEIKLKRGNFPFPKQFSSLPKEVQP